MIFPEAELPLLKDWIVKRLENTSDADPEVLADYVLALLKHDGDDAAVRALCEEELHSFLDDGPTANASAEFIEDLFEATYHKAYLPGHSIPAKSSRNINHLPQNPVLSPLASRMSVPGTLKNLRKRSFQDRFEAEPALAYGDPYLAANPKHTKKSRRGGARGYARGGRSDILSPGFTIPTPVATGTVTTFVPGGTGAFASNPNTFDPRFSADLPPIAQQHTPNIGPHILGRMESYPSLQKQYHSHSTEPIAQQGLLGSQKHRIRCRDYDTKGYCARGQSCIYEHGSESIFVSAMPNARDGQYDPHATQIPPPGPLDGVNGYPQPFSIPHLSQFTFNGMSALPLMGSQNTRRKGKSLAPISAVGAVQDRNISAIVVANIPQENFEEGQVAGFFSQFGSIVDISLQPARMLAIIQYDSYDAAHAALKSPKAIFDNRFVKVYWYKDAGNLLPSSDEAAGNSQGSISQEVDMVELLRKQDEAQKKHEERMKQKEKVNAQREQLEHRQKEIDDERCRLVEKLIAKGVDLHEKPNSSDDDDSDNDINISTGDEVDGDGDQKVSSLRAQLKALQAEAKTFGIDPDEDIESVVGWAPGSSFRGRGRGRGYFRGGRGSFRGGYWGRGGLLSQSIQAAYAAYSLDNRPKKISLRGLDFTEAPKDEALRQHLLGVGVFTDIQITPEITTITFKDRKTAEKFVNGVRGNQIPNIDGKVELAWVLNSPSKPASAASRHTSIPPPPKLKLKKEDENYVSMSGIKDESVFKQIDDSVPKPPEDVDYDVADDDDWGEVT